jgi:hypothetical protein
VIELLRDVLGRLQASLRQEQNARRKDALLSSCYQLETLVDKLQQGDEDREQIYGRFARLIENLAESALAGSNGAVSSEKEREALLASARAAFSEEEILEGIREVRESGGLELRDFIRELQEVPPSKDE